MPADYDRIRECTESWYDRLGDSPLGMGWPNLPDAVRRYDVMMNVIPELRPGGPPVRLLDLGCGCGHFLEHLQSRGMTQIEYTGIDLSERFIRRCRLKYPHADFRHMDVLKTPDQLPVFDYAVINGVFTSRCGMSFEDMWSFVRRLVTLTWQHTRIGLAFNAISKQVDWEREDLFHLPLDVVAGFLCSELSRHFVIRNDYGIYEFTVYLYHERQL